MKRRALLLYLILLLSGAILASGQDRKLHIRFLDPSCGDSPIKGVKVTVEGSPRFSKSYKTDRDGWFTAKKLPEGTYKLDVQKYGFKRYLINDINLTGDSKLFEFTYKLERGYPSYDPNVGNPKYKPCKHEDKDGD